MLNGKSPLQYAVTGKNADDGVVVSVSAIYGSSPVAFAGKDSHPDVSTEHSPFEPVILTLE